MRRIALGILLLVAGCSPVYNYSGGVTVEKTDGKVQTVKVVMPHPSNRNQCGFEVKSREDMDKIISGLESLLLDLKAARDQMPTVEPKQESK